MLKLFTSFKIGSEINSPLNPSKTNVWILEKREMNVLSCARLAVRDAIRSDSHRALRIAAAVSTPSRRDVEKYAKVPKIAAMAQFFTNDSVTAIGLAPNSTSRAPWKYALNIFQPFHTINKNYLLHDTACIETTCLCIIHREILGYDCIHDHFIFIIWRVLNVQSL